MATDETAAGAAVCPACGLLVECFGCGGRGLVVYGPGVAEACEGCKGGRDRCRCPRADGDSPVGAVWAGDVARATAAPAAAPVGSRMRGRPMSEVAREPIEWLWPGHLAAGMIHLIDGDPGLGKSTLTLDLAARASTGAPWPDGTAGGKPVTVLLLGAEDGLAHTVRPRLDVAGADVDRVHAITDVVTATGDERLPSLPLDVERLGDYAGEHEAGLVVIDPLMAYLSADVNTGVDRDVRHALLPLARMAEARRLAVLLVRHLRKAAGSALHRGGASIGIIGAARFGYVVGRLPGDEQRRAIAPVKANLVVEPDALAFSLVDADGAARVEWHGRVDVTADELVSGDGDEGLDAAAWLHAYLSEKGGSAEQRDVLQAGHKEGFSKDALKRAKKRAGAVSQKGAMAAGWSWVLPAEGSAKGAKGAGAESPRSSLPSVLPSADDGDADRPAGPAAGVDETTKGAKGAPVRPSRPSATRRPAQRRRSTSDQGGTG